MSLSHLMDGRAHIAKPYEMCDSKRLLSLKHRAGEKLKTICIGIATANESIEIKCKKKTEQNNKNRSQFYGLKSIVFDVLMSIFLFDLNCLQ